MISRWNDPNNKDDRTLEKMFKNGNESQNVEAYAEFFEL
jgi:hypothetical protein